MWGSPCLRKALPTHLRFWETPEHSVEHSGEHSPQVAARNDGAGTLASTVLSWFMWIMQVRCHLRDPWASGQVTPPVSAAGFNPNPNPEFSAEPAPFVALCVPQRVPCLVPCPQNPRLWIYAQGLMLHACEWLLGLGVPTWVSGGLTSSDPTLTLPGPRLTEAGMLWCCLSTCCPQKLGFT